MLQRTKVAIELWVHFAWHLPMLMVHDWVFFGSEWIAVTLGTGEMQ
jgi:hypothetical protein